MNDCEILNDFFKNQNDEIDFQLFKEVNVIKLTNNNRDKFVNNSIQFNTKDLSSNIINYSNAYIELEIELEVPFEEGDQGKKSIPKLVALKNSYEIVDSLRISLNRVIVSNETNINRSNLVNYVLNNSYNDPTQYRNITKSNQSTLNITNNLFITKDTYYTKLDDHNEANKKNHFIDFNFGIWLKDISDFFRKVDILQYAEFTIDIKLINGIFLSSRTGIRYKIKSAYLVVEEVKLKDEDNIKYFNMLDNNLIRKINFLENYIDIYNDKLNRISNDFSLLSVRNSDNVFIYGISDTKK